MQKYKSLIIGAGILLVIAGYFVSKYNTMVSLRNETGVAWAQVENQLQRRFDLVPQLVGSVQQVLKQEGSDNVYVQLADARRAYTGARNVDEQMVAAQSLNSGLSRLLAITENYPELKASENIRDLQSQLEGSENRLAVERGRYNEIVGKYNGYIIVIPNKFIASLFGFDTMQAFDAETGSEIRPDVKGMFENK